MGVIVNGGSYDLTIEVVADSKTATSNVHQITALAPPIVDAGSDQIVDITATVNFDGSASYDPDGGNIVSYSWDFGSDASPATGSGVNPSCTYSTVGEKRVTLTVTDDEGSTASATCTITVTLPVADAGDDQTVDLNATVHFDGSRSHDPDGGPLTYLWSFPGSKADSATDTDTATPSVVYDTPGEKTVTLTVTDDEGNQVSGTCKVRVSPPVALPGNDQIVALNTTVDEAGVSTSSVTVSFNGSASYDPGDEDIPGKGITAWKWDFPGGDPVSATAATASTRYTTPGEKTVSLTVTDNDEPALETTASITVTVVKLTLAASGTPTRGESATYTATVQPSGLNPTFSWKFTGGGGPEIPENTGSTNTWSGKMVVSGTIEVTATVNGVTFTKSMNTTVTNRSWSDTFPALPTTNNGQGGLPANPTMYEHLGQTMINSPPVSVVIITVPTGPNKGWMFVESAPTGAWSHFANINDALYNTNHLFYVVNRARYGQSYMGLLAENVEIHEGVTLESGYESHASKARDTLNANPLNSWAESQVAHNTVKDAQPFADEVNQNVVNRRTHIETAAGARGGSNAWHPANKHPNLPTPLPTPNP